MHTSYTQEERVLGGSSKFVIEFEPGYTRQHVSINGGHFPCWLARTGSDVTATSSARFARRTRDNFSLSMELCCLR